MKITKEEAYRIKEALVKNMSQKCKEKFYSMNQNLQNMLSRVETSLR